MPSYCEELSDILYAERLAPVFQPIIGLSRGEILGYEGLIRGPSDSMLHSPALLFQAAEDCGLLTEVEHLCRRVTLARYAALGLPGKLFLNVSPDCLLDPDYQYGRTLSVLGQFGLSPTQIIIEITESRPHFDYALMRQAVGHYRSMGFRIAIDDLGEGFASLRLWSELRPDYVKVDKHFVQNIHLDPVKQQFLRSIGQIAENAESRVIAEGIETGEELQVLRGLGISHGQGYFIARPSAHPPRGLDSAVRECFRPEQERSQGTAEGRRLRGHAGQLLQAVAPVAPDTPNAEIYERFAAEPELFALPVVGEGLPLGLLKRHQVLESFAKPFSRELLGRKDCTLLMDKRPMIVDAGMSLQELSRLVASAERHHLADGFIITRQGRYAGMGSGHALMRELTELQITAARYANPLTLLPGNVPIHEHIDHLLAEGLAFTAAYFDIDGFKPFNDRYGYRRGDALIERLGRLLEGQADGERDFVGHIGGDDFLVLFQSADWEARCRRVLAGFDAALPELVDAGDRLLGGYVSENRRGAREFHALPGLSVGALRVPPDSGLSHHDIASAAAEAKRQAKKQPGSSLFVERRTVALSPGARDSRSLLPDRDTTA